VGICHGQHVESFVELLLGQLLAVDEAELDDGLADGDAVGERLLRGFGGVLVPDVLVQRCDDRRGGLGVLPAPCLVSGDAVDATVSQQPRDGCAR
jgi:hypothetical protein